jgi:putative transposase
MTLHFNHPKRHTVLASATIAAAAACSGDSVRPSTPGFFRGLTMVAETRQRGLELTGPGGLLKLFTKNVLETALSEEMTEHLGHEKNQAEEGRGSRNVRIGARSKMVALRS